MSVRLCCKLAGGAIFPLHISLLCVECHWQENLIDQEGVDTLRPHICKSASQ